MNEATPIVFETASEVAARIDAARIQPVSRDEARRLALAALAAYHGAESMADWFCQFANEFDRKATPPELAKVVAEILENCSGDPAVPLAEQFQDSLVAYVTRCGELFSHANALKDRDSGSIAALGIDS